MELSWQRNWRKPQISAFQLRLEFAKRCYMDRFSWRVVKRITNKSYQLRACRSEILPPGRDLLGNNARINKTEIQVNGEKKTNDRLGESTTYRLIYLLRILYFVIFLHYWSLNQTNTDICTNIWLNLRLLMSYIYGAPSKARNANVVYIWTYVWQRWNSLFLFAAQCLNTESMQRGFLCHICV